MSQEEGLVDFGGQSSGKSPIPVVGEDLLGFEMSPH